ncbi:MAG: hypothetical protein ACRBI6_23515, partial [Acidimicrobiales bacterium]
MADRPSKKRVKRVPPPPRHPDQGRVERIHDEREAPQPKPRRRREASFDLSEVEFGAVAPDTARKLAGRLAEAAEAFEAERFADAVKLLGSIERLAPSVAEVLELRGLANYRLGKWRPAIKDLEAFETLVGTVEQHPVLADCHRALGHHGSVEDLWLELGEASPAAE